jgi:hypothetical protein
MTITAYLVIGIVGLVSTTASFVRTPDPDRPRAYPNEPDRWAGLTATPAPAGRRPRHTIFYTLRHAAGSLLFYATGAAAFGAVGAIYRASMPGLPAASLLAASLAGAVASVVTARRMLRAGPGAMKTVDRSSKTGSGMRPRVLFICGSPNQTSQMHQIARALPEVDAWFTPYFSDHWAYRILIKLGLLETTILGLRRRGICLDYLNAQGLPVDFVAERHVYDLCISCNDQVLPSCLDDRPWILVQEGIQEPPSWRTWVWRSGRIGRLVPAPAAGTAVFGLSDRYTCFCVASEGYRRRYLAEGIAAEKLVVTGIPNFDDFARFRESAFPHRGFVLVCTSDARETLLAADRRALLERAVEIAAGRPLIFKLHPNERVDRATREIHEIAPSALVFAGGSAEEMVAHCDVLITEWSSLTFCGIALGKEVHSLHSLDEVRDLLPVQNGRAAQEIAAVARDLLARAASHETSSAELAASSLS